jgi:hypothetical protein
MSDATGQKPTDDELEEYKRNLGKVDWDLPGMDKFGEDTRRWLTKAILDGDIVEAMCSLGWSFWPTTNRGYYDERHLRAIADFLEIQNKPFWDSYEKYCSECEDLWTDDDFA